MPAWETGVMRDTRANQPTPTADQGGILYWVTDESVLERWSGTAWEAYSAGFDADVLPWHIFIPCAASTPDATVGTWAQNNPGDVADIYKAMLYNSSVAQNDAVAWDVVLAAGTWDVHFWVRRSTNTAIGTVAFDGTAKGTSDTYNASPDYSKRSVTGIVVATTAKVRVSIAAATKNASSSGYVLGIYAVELRRTA